ncbi:MAG: hypothetical protein A2Y16_03395 [Tenericutes bacterium GWF2_57_13]|nr:MAG: hypothetical protein A2Y16_03395 [Tenericutes bacterium GWF2_57_13]
MVVAVVVVGAAVVTVVGAAVVTVDAVVASVVVAVVRFSHENSMKTSDKQIAAIIVFFIVSSCVLFCISCQS